MRPFTQTAPTVPLVRHAGPMASGDDMHERNDIPELATALDELRTLLRAFGEVGLANMDTRFYVHAYNELDLAGRTIIDAFDREQRSTGRSH